MDAGSSQRRSKLQSHLLDLGKAFGSRWSRWCATSKKLPKELLKDLDFWLASATAIVVLGLSFFGRFSGSPGHLTGVDLQVWGSLTAGLAFALSTTGLVFVAAMPGDRATQTLMLLSLDPRSQHVMKVVEGSEGRSRVLKRIDESEGPTWVPALEEDLVAAQNLRNSYGDLLHLFQYVARVSLLALALSLAVHWQFGNQPVFQQASVLQALALAAWAGMLTYLGLHVLATLRALTRYGSVRRAEVVTWLSRTVRTEPPGTS